MKSIVRSVVRSIVRSIVKSVDSEVDSEIDSEIDGVRSIGRSIEWDVGFLPPRTSLSPAGWSYGYIGGWRVRSQWNGEPLTGKSEFGFVSCVRGCGRGEVAWAGERKDSAIAGAEARPVTPPPPQWSGGGAGVPSWRLGVPLRWSGGGAGVPPWCPVGVPMVSRRCPAGVPSVSRGCPVGVPRVSRRCPVGVPSVSRWCPVGVSWASHGVPW